jgi:FKBP-type peptidyl-prolyl cis-trans isomerase
MPLRSVSLAIVLLFVTGCSNSGPAPAEKPGLPPPPDVAAPPPNSVRAASGLSTRVLQPGTGQRHPRTSDTVVVHYTGWTTDGKMFDSSVQRGQPAEFQVSGVIRGWTEALQMMVEGEKRRVWIPESLAYKGEPGQPQGMLVFDVELIDIK